MTAGETLLKLSDYPFAYSLIGLLATSFGFEVSQHHLIYLGVAGAVGTLLTIIDPFGWLVKGSMKQKLKNSNDPNVQLLEYEKEFAVQAINTKSIGIEIDRIVGILYFAVTATIFIIAVFVSPEFDKNFIMEDKNGKTICSLSCVHDITGYFGSFISSILIVVGGIRWRELFDKISVAGMHQFAISSEYPTINSVENMTRAVDQNDWETAKKWGQKIGREIKNKNAKKEIIIKAAQDIYQPLHQESVVIDSSCRNNIESKHYYTINVQKWYEIKSKSMQKIIDEEEVIQSIDSFYNKINEYNNFIVPCNKKIESTISKRMTEVYKEKISKVRYWVTTNDGVKESDLIGCIEFNVLPLEFYDKDAIFHQLDIGLTIEGGSIRTNTTTEPSDSELFDKAWQLISKDLSDDSELQKLRNLFQTLFEDNTKLMVKYSEKIQMQLRV